MIDLPVKKISLMKNFIIHKSYKGKRLYQTGTSIPGGWNLGQRGRREGVKVGPGTM